MDLEFFLDNSNPDKFHLSNTNLIHKPKSCLNIWDSLYLFSNLAYISPFLPLTELHTRHPNEGRGSPIIWEMPRNATGQAFHSASFGYHLQIIVTVILSEERAKNLQ